jgi:hypothetical protein
MQPLRNCLVLLEAESSSQQECFLSARQLKVLLEVDSVER